MLAATAYFTRGLQLLLGSSKRAVIERAEEMGSEEDDIPLTQLSRNTQIPEASSTIDLALQSMQNQDITLPSRAQDPSQVRGTGGPPQSEPPKTNPRPPPPPPKTTHPAIRTPNNIPLPTPTATSRSTPSRPSPTMGHHSQSPF